MTASSRVQNFTALENAMLRDPSLRAIRNTETFKETVRVMHLGLREWNRIAILGFLETARRSASIERVTNLANSVDAMTKIVSVTPNIQSRNKEDTFDGDE